VIAAVLDESLRTVDEEQQAASALPEIIEVLLASTGAGPGNGDLGLTRERLDEFVGQMTEARQGAINNHPKKRRKRTCGHC
jgi:hypothetical protein